MSPRNAALFARFLLSIAWLVRLGAACLALTAVPAAADTGVSEERVSLPDGPGSIGGIGENALVEGNMGSMSLSVPLRVPAGFGGVTPDLALVYGSESGASVVGIGWGFGTPSIDRMTSRGLPEYTTADRFAADGSAELVKVSETMTSAVYRARYEGAFVRYTWHDPADGKGGYFTAESPGGLITYYGADRNGNLVQNARISHPDGGVFSYLAVETVDPFGHRLHYAYTVQDGYPLVDTMDYVHDAAGTARFSVRFVYEERPDVVSDGKPGFDLTLTSRLSEVRIFSGSEQIRGYALEYETVEVSGGMSRLRKVSERGRGGELYPIEQSFAYSRALGGACVTDCEKPFVVDMGTLSGGVDLQSGASTLIDINGDGLPDVLDTTGGVHRFYISKPASDGRPSFAAEAVTSTASTSAFVLGAPSVQVVDVDGNGFTDMISTKTGDVLCNDGSGDWNGSACLADASLDIELEDDPDTTGESDPLHVRFFDYDNDKRMDLLRTPSEASADVRRDTGNGFEAASVDALGAAFDESTLQLADMNGDGLQDPVELLTGGQLRYRLNLGRGTWTDWVSVSIPDLSDGNVPVANIEDINGDGLDDVVVVTADTLQYWLNRNGASFDAPVAVTSANVNGELPETTATTTVLFADMNGNGSNDVVWVSSSGHVQFLDLFPVKPNLLARVENGIGMVQEITYGTSLAELARDGSWEHRLNYGVNIVTSLDTWVTLSGDDGGKGLHELSSFAYHDGFYDGKEKQFRGFTSVDRTLQADDGDGQEPGMTVSTYDVGATDPYHAGLLLQADTYSGTDDKRVALRSSRTEYDDCAVEGVPADLVDVVRYVCPTTEIQVNQEGLDESAWATTKQTLEYDGYGNVVRSSNLGLVNMGSPEKPAACAACVDGDDVACGDDCAGDETYTETEYIVPGDDTVGAWLLSLPLREVVYGVEGGPQAETQYFYDGDDFAGLAAGKAAQGKLTRVMGRNSSDDDDFVALTRSAFDEHGNIIASLDPLGAPDDLSGHRREYVYDGLGLDLIAAEVLLSDANGPYSLRRELSYESSFNQVSESTEWTLTRDGDAQSSRDSSSYRYDAQGRVAKIISPGDSEDAPSQEFSYSLASPVSTVSIASRSKAGAAADGFALQCMDGRGRVVQNVRKIAEGRFIADGLKVYNSRGAIVRDYESFELTDGACSMSPPGDVPFTSYRYDPLFRLLETTQPDAELYDGKASTEHVEYGPLSVSEYDSEDEAGGAYEGTPTTRRYDGAGRPVSIERVLKSGGKPEVTRLRYDSLDRMTGYIDPAGNMRKQTFDLLGRVTEIDDPNSGKTSIDYDAAGNVLRKQDAAGAVMRFAYDGVNRISKQWDDADEKGSLVSYTYDALADCEACTASAARLVEVRYPVVLGDQRSDGADRFGFDARRRMVYQARQLEGVWFETEHEYDGRSRLVRTSFPDGQQLTRSYDGADRVVGIDGVLDELSYDERGRPERETFANGASASYEYDVLDRLSRDTLSDGKDDALFDVSFQRDRVGNVVSAKDAVKPKDGRIARGYKSSYDAYYRTTETTLALDAAREEQVAWAYSAIDNVVSRTSSLKDDSPAQLGAYSYGKQPNAVTKAGPHALAYDASGNLSKRDGVTLDWDYQNRLVSAQRDGEVVGEFAYGANEERVIKLEGGHVVYYLNPEFELRDGISAVHPRLDGARLARLQSDALATTVLSDVDGDDKITVADAWLVQSGQNGKEKGSDVERLLAASARRMLFEAEDATTFLHDDHHSDVVAATNAKGELIAERSFFPNGLPRESTGFVDDYGFSGQERDDSTGLVHYRFRYLEPTLGRWASVDPAFEVVSSSSMGALGEATTGYAFVGNRLGNSIDPTGLKGQAKGKAKTGGKKKAAAKKKPAREPSSFEKGFNKRVYAARKGIRENVTKPAGEAATAVGNAAGAASDAVGNAAHSAFKGVANVTGGALRKVGFDSKGPIGKQLSKVSNKIAPFATRPRHVAKEDGEGGEQGGGAGLNQNQLNARIFGAILTGVALAIGGTIGGTFAFLDDNDDEGAFGSAGLGANFAVGTDRGPPAASAPDSGSRVSGATALAGPPSGATGTSLMNDGSNSPSVSVTFTTLPIITPTLVDF